MDRPLRNKSAQLKILESLDARTPLSYAQQQYLLNLKKGYQGEWCFDELIDHYFGNDVTVIKDLRIAYNGSAAQIDALIAFGNTITLYEVKNYEGEYIQLPGQFRKLKGQESICPSVQLNRTKKVLEQIVNQWSRTIEIRCFVIFVNPAFILYDAEVGSPFIFPPQIASHFETLSKNQIETTKECINIMNKLKSESQSGEKYRGTPPKYTWEDMRKGSICRECRSFSLSLTQRRATCQDCKNKCSIDKLIFEHIKEMSLLFPEAKLTTAALHEWMGGNVRERKIRNYLKENPID